jgi:hypothetical protein
VRRAGVLDAVNHGGTYKWPGNNTVFPRFQVITVAQLLDDVRPKMPPLLLPYIAATRKVQTFVQDELIDDAG